MSERGPADVEAALQAAGIAYRRYRAHAARADQAAESLGVTLGAVVKSLLFLADGAPALVLVGGDRRVDTRRLKGLLGARRVMIASAERVTAETGYPPGAVPPVGCVAPLPVWIDAGLAQHATVYVSGGAVDEMIALAFEDLRRATGGQIADVGM
ncbi:MAG: YbaK/EbsC family protein [Anaerolineae bacterium]|nr:YbaK/EbsC family protein [Anaerolineae bacterium]